MHAFDRISLSVLRWGSLGLLTLSVFIAVYAFWSDTDNMLRRYLARYTTYLDRKLRLMFIRKSATEIVRWQGVGLVAVVAIGMLFSPPYWYIALVPALVGPAWYIEHLRRERVVAIDGQVDGFLLALSNALRSTPSIGDAINSLQYLLAQPLRDELELTSKEMRIGATLDQSLLNMAARVGSRQLDAALSAILIGRQVGGNLPKILATIAASMREMTRLDGVVRMKTADARSQLFALAVAPAGLVVLLNATQPDYFKPLSGNMIGYAIVAAACAFWIIALVLARRLLVVDV